MRPVLQHGARAPVKPAPSASAMSAVTRALTVRGPYTGASGHDHHTREFVRHLRAAGVRVELLDVPEWSPLRLPERLREPAFDALGAPVGARAVLHCCMPHQVALGRGRLHVNYTMFEATRIPARWVACGLRHDLVVVPTTSSRDAWTQSGFPEARIRLCPLGVAAGTFHPGVAPLALADRRGRPVASYGTRILNVSELIPRKNVLGLLRVWLQATRASDDAILIVKLGRSAGGSTVAFMRELDAMERAMGASRKDAAPVLFLDRLMADAEMPPLFATATHYWSMSRGEGWDQPMMEAAATGLRLIAPRHSAYTAYLDDATAAMIPARRVPAVIPGDAGLAELFSGAEWWEPDPEAAATAIGAAVRGADPPRASARDRVATEFTWEKATARLIAILEELHGSHGLAF
jgi:glycosyltransferase involved in cell wall biosynthesis